MTTGTHKHHTTCKITTGGNTNNISPVPVSPPLEYTNRPTPNPYPTRARHSHQLLFSMLSAWRISQGVPPPPSPLSLAPPLPPTHPPTHMHALTHTQPDEIGFIMLARLRSHETTNTSYMSTAEYNKKTDSRRGVGKGEGYGRKLARINNFYQTFRKKYSTSSEQQCRKRVGQSQTALTDKPAV